MKRVIVWGLVVAVGFAVTVGFFVVVQTNAVNRALPGFHNAPSERPRWGL